MRVRSKLEEKPSSLKCGATNAKIKTAFVEYSTHESIKKRCTQHQSKSYTHSTRSLFDWYVWFLSMVGFSIPRTFTLRSILPTPVILREAEGEVAESIIQHDLRPSGEGGPSKTVGDGQTKILFLTPNQP